MSNIFDTKYSNDRKESQNNSELISELLHENGLKMEQWRAFGSKNLFKTFSLGKHFSSLEENKYRDKNIQFVKDSDPEDFKGKLKMLCNEKNYLEFLKHPDNPKFEMVIFINF